MTNQIILASGSPRRKEILKQAGLNFKVIPSKKEEITSFTEPEKIVEELAFIKADDIKTQAPENSIIIGADTIVCNQGAILGKPKNKPEAIQMLLNLQGHEHSVYTGVCIILKQGNQIKVRKFAELTRVKVASLSKEKIEEYCYTGEPMDKAGAYAIQGLFAKYIEGIVGDYYNVVGFPIARFWKEMEELGVSI
jgi:septum formation protein